MKIGALIPIRLASERLPGKALKDICGRPAVHHLLDRVAACRFITDRRDVVVCTTTHASDDPLISVVESCGCSCFRGSVDDIVRRLGDAMAFRGFDAVVHAFGDNPLTATEYMDRTMERLLGDPEIGIVSAANLPLGTASYSFTSKAMQTVLSSYCTERNDTGFMYFFTRTGLCRHVQIEADAEHRHDQARLTMDYEADLALFRAIFDVLYRPGKPFTLAETVAFLRAHPGLAASNTQVHDEYWRRTAEKAQLQYRDAAGQTRSIELNLH
jgi:spore coat polysaccharide biosynthesis protein SpsF (cytidylyltransferase family)